MTVTILQGDVRDRLRELSDESVHCVVTSPPYWGLRDYGTAKWVGGDTGCEHVISGAKRTPWANEVKGPGNAGKNGTQYANMTKWVGGECVVCGAQKVDEQIGLETCLGGHIDALVDVFREVRRVLRKDGTLWLNYGDAYASSPNGRSAADTKAVGNDDRTFRDKPISTVGGTLKPKDRMLLPARVAIALQDDGWWVRDEIVWHKPNPMPSSVKDRTTPAHEFIYMLSKAPKYYYDQEAVLEPASPNTHARVSQDLMAQVGSFRANGGDKTNGPMKAVMRGSTRKLAEAGSGTAANRSFEAALCLKVEKRNPRSVWTIAPKGFKEAHFATFPPKLIEPCILAGCPAGGTVLDPFFGAGTTGLVCQELNRNCIGIELNAAYVTIAENRLGLRQVSETETIEALL